MSYFGSQPKRKRSKKGFVVIKGKAYPIGSMKPKSRHKPRNDNSMWGSNSMWGNQPNRKQENQGIDIDQTITNFQAGYKQIKSSPIGRMIGKKIAERKVKKRKVDTFQDNLRTKKMQPDYFR